MEGKRDLTAVLTYKEQKKRLVQQTQNYKKRFGHTEKSCISIALGHALVGPIIYAMVIPLFIFDLSVFIYQHIAFRIYQIPIVRRQDYFVIDRHRLEYLNWLEKFNCIYCGYGNGVASYGKEIIARTEQYWCPIKHQERIKDPHSKYENFLDYNDAKAYQKNIADVIRKYDKEEI